MTAFAASLVITATSIGASFSTFAAGPNELPVLPAEDQQNVPAKFDLRNVGGKNYVTPVKFQNPFGNCWAFAAAAAAETTYLYQNGLGVAAGQENNTIDISEKHTSWYSHKAMTKADVSGSRIPASQVGEGNTISEDASETLNEGGKLITGFDTFARFGGPVDESTQINGETPFSYNGKNKWKTRDKDISAEQLNAQKEYALKKFTQEKILKGETSIAKIKAAFEKEWADEDYRSLFLLMYCGEGGRQYAVYDDWSLPVNSQYRLADSIAQIKNYKVFPLASKDEDSGKHIVNSEYLKTIKAQISSGHAMIATVFGDDGQDGGILGGTTYMNTQTWAQYVNNNDEEADHEVTVVGYDDNYAKENFVRKDKNGNNDPTTIPPANGAFIVKNSYGCITEQDKKDAKKGPDGELVYDRVGANEFGINDSGYYYLSYYDMSLNELASVDLYKTSEQHAENANQYDLLTPDSFFHYNIKSGRNMSANVFTAQQSEILSEISVSTVSSIDKAEIKYSIYKNFKGSDPTTGELLESGNKTFSQPGFYRFALDNEYLLKKDEKYAVVIEQNILIPDYPDEMISVASIPISLNGKSVVNSGESLLFENGKWVDLTQNEKSVKEYIFESAKKELPAEMIDQFFPQGADCIAIDNFPIRAYTTPAAVRFAGKNRYDTAARISSESGLFNNSDTVVIANGVNFADALAGVPLAKAYNAPILLTAKDMLPADTANEIKRLGASNAIILGGPGAVSETVEKDLTKLGLNTKRLSGQTRFATAKRVAEALEKQTGKAPTEVFFVIYDNFADALSASTAAAAKGAPILYVTKEGAIDKFTELYLEKNGAGIKKAYVIGGEGVITDEMKNSLSNALGGRTVERVAGANRYATCVAVNEKFSSVLKGKDLCVAKGGDFPDALAGGVFAALHESPLFLAGPVLIDTQIEYLNKKKVDTVYVFGGTGAVSDTVIKHIRNCIAS